MTAPAHTNGVARRQPDAALENDDGADRPRHHKAAAGVDGSTAADSLWRSAPLIAVLLVVAAGALLPSFVAVREYAAHIGAHRQLIWGAPLCLDGLALSAAYAWIDRHTRGLPSGSAPWSAVGAALATLAVNALHANPDLLDPGVGRVALSLLAPIAAFAAFHLVFESLTQHRTIASDDDAARETGRADHAGDAQREHATAVTRPAPRSHEPGDRRVFAAAAQRSRRDDADAQPPAQADAHPQSRAARRRITRTISTKETKVTELIDVVSDDTVREIVADWLASGGDVHDPALTARVEQALGKSRRTAQLHLQPARQAAAASTDPPQTPRA